MLYKKKPVVVEATQWFPGLTVPGVFAHDEAKEGGWPDEYRYYVITIHGQKTTVAPGDWIITEPGNKHHYPCKPEIFAGSYEAV